MEHPTTGLHALPNEILQEIWILSENPDLPLASPTLCSALDNWHIRRSFNNAFSNAFAILLTNNHNIGFRERLEYWNFSDATDRLSSLLRHEACTFLLFYTIMKKVRDRAYGNSQPIPTITGDCSADDFILMLSRQVAIPERLLRLPFTPDNMGLLQTLVAAGATALEKTAKVQLLLALFSPAEDAMSVSQNTYVRLRHGNDKPRWNDDWGFSLSPQTVERFVAFFYFCRMYRWAPGALLPISEADAILKEHMKACQGRGTEKEDDISNRLKFFFTRGQMRSFFEMGCMTCTDYQEPERFPVFWKWARTHLRVPVQRLFRTSDGELVVREMYPCGGLLVAGKRELANEEETDRLLAYFKRWAMARISLG